MKRSLGALTVVGLLLLTGTVGDTIQPAEAQPLPAYFSTDNVELVGSLPEETDSAGGRILGKYFYMTTSRGLSIFDISEPTAPQKVGSLPLPQEPQITEEDPDTNGKILLVGALGTLNVIDVSDKTAPAIVGTLDGADNHTISCVLDCTYAYGSDGVIVDLRDPANPKLVGDWLKGMPASGSHDVTEIAPGEIVASSQPILYLDARDDPTKPEVVAVGANEDQRFIHANLWPHKGDDDFLLVGGETVGNCDDAGSGAFMVWDARTVGATRTFKMIDEIRMVNGNPSEGNAVANSFCSHWFTTHPTYRNGGLVATAWYEHGTRFFQVTGEGKIKEVGWFIPVAGATSGAYWVNDRILYAVDYQRGIDILRYTGKTFYETGSSGGGGGGGKLRGPGVRFGASDKTPRFGDRIRFRTRLERCKGHRGTSIELRRKVKGEFRTIERKPLNNRCRARFNIVAEFSQATFKATWPKQDRDHRRGKSKAITVRTHR